MWDKRRSVAFRYCFAITSVGLAVWIRLLLDPLLGMNCHTSQSFSQSC
jgi:hypothetical protein